MVLDFDGLVILRARLDIEIQDKIPGSDILMTSLI